MFFLGMLAGAVALGAVQAALLTGFFLVLGSGAR